MSDFLDEKRKNNPVHTIPKSAVAVIFVNLVFLLVVLPYLVLSYRNYGFRQTFTEYVILGVACVPIALGILYLLYRVFWWGFALLFTVLSLILGILVFRMVLQI